MSGKRPATYQDVLDAPENMIAELIDGELILSPRPRSSHASIATVLGAKLVSRFSHGSGGPDGWIILLEPELHLDGRVLVPDWAGWRTNRMPQLADEAGITIPPDWVCEIASKSTEKLDRKKKLPIYAGSGVGHAWIIQPRIRVLEVLRRHEAAWMNVGYYSDNDVVRAEPFEELELDLASLWWGLPLRLSEYNEGELELY